MLLRHINLWGESPKETGQACVLMITEACGILHTVPSGLHALQRQIFLPYCNVATATLQTNHYGVTAQGSP
ncbi:MAG: hypothetical protein LIO74_03730 [Ruminococcus sp.]|nr:hypothetical protein [Ruminococcus sp.]